jgi:hypothetical protein
MEGWHDFFVAEVGAAAALVGLLFVALSINLTEILKYAYLPACGAQTLLVLTGALLESSLALVPEARSALVASASIAIAVLTWGFSLQLARTFVRGAEEQKEVALSRDRGLKYIGLTQIATLPPIVGSVLLLARHADGYYWIAFGLLATLAYALYNAWILLIEILR